MKDYLAKRINRYSKIAFRKSSQYLTRKQVEEFDKSGRIYQVNGQKFDIPGDDLTDQNFRNRFIAGGYESEEEYELLKKYLIRDGRVIELGGCLGVASCYINSLMTHPGAPYCI